MPAILAAAVVDTAAAAAQTAATYHQAEPAKEER
jgi:hypothetical protein